MDSQIPKVIGNVLHVDKICFSFSLMYRTYEVHEKKKKSKQNEVKESPVSLSVYSFSIEAR